MKVEGGIYPWGRSDPAATEGAESLRSRRSHQPRRWVLAGVILASLALGLAACGSSSGSGGSASNGEINKPVKQIEIDVENAMGKLSNFHLSGTVNSGGQQIGLNLVATSSGPAGGSMSVGGKTFDIVVDNKVLYFKGDAHFWQSEANLNTSEANLLARKWITGNFGNSTLADFAPMTQVSSFVGNLRSGNDSKAKVGKITTIGGHSAIPVSSGGGTVYVAASGPPYILKLAGGGNEITFDHFGTATVPKVPTNAVNFGNVSSGG